MDQGSGGGGSEIETIDIGCERERSQDQIQNFWLEHRDRVAA